MIKKLIAIITIIVILSLNCKATLQDEFEIKYIKEETYYDTFINVEKQIEYFEKIYDTWSRFFVVIKDKVGVEDIKNYNAFLSAILALREQYNNLSKFTYGEWRMLATTTDYEAHGCGLEHKEYVCQVVLNRCKDERFNDNIYDNLIRPNQYNTIYVNPYYSDIRAKDHPELWEESLLAAKNAMMGKVDMPENVIFQSNYSNLGKGHWKIIEVDTGWFKSTTYFSYG